MANDSPTHSGVSADRWLAKAFGETSVSGGARSARSDGGVRDSRASIRSEVRDAWRFKRLKNLKISIYLAFVCARSVTEIRDCAREDSDTIVIDVLVVAYVTDG